MTENTHSIVPASYLIFQKDNKILLLRRCNTNYEDGNYSLVAGHVYEGETFTQAAVREAKEETGVEIEEKDLEVVHIMQRNSKTGNRDERIDVFFVVKKWKGEIRNMEEHKCDDLSWFPIDSLPENTIPFIKEIFKNISKKKFYSEYGWK